MNTLVESRDALLATVAQYRRRLAAAPTAHDFAILGSTLTKLDETDEALSVFESGLGQYPDDLILAEGRAVCLDYLRRTGEAIAAYAAIVTRAPASQLAWNNLGSTLNRQGRNAEAIAAFRRAEALAPDNAVFASNVLLALNYQDGHAPDGLLAQHRAWDQRLAARVAPTPAHHANPPDPERRLRVGYLSADFRAHPVAYFMGAILAAHDRRQFEVFCYSSTRQPDAVTRTLQGMPLSWRDISGLDDDAAARLVTEDGIDLLVDLGGHTGDHRLLVMARRPAPVQGSYLGYPNTTGMAAIDFRFTDFHADPPGAADGHHSETLLRLDGGFLAYTPPANMPAVGPLPALTNGHFTFGSFTNLAKVSASTFDLWSAALTAVPGSRLLMKAREFDDAATRARFHGQFSARGIDAARAELRAGPHPAEAHFNVWNSVDLALDTYPYNGTTTSCESLWMGVPLLTLAGDRHAARVGASLLHAVGLPGLIADSPAEFAAKAVALAGDLPALASARKALRERLRRSPLLDPRRLARQLEQHLRGQWRDWCARQMAQ